MKLLSVVLTTLLLGTVFGLSQEPPRPGDPQIGAEGRLVVLKVVPGENTLKLFFAGKRAAQIDFAKEHKLLSVKAEQNGRIETLKFRNMGDSYEVTELPKGKDPYSLEVKSEVRGKIEELKVKVPNSKP